MAIDDEDAQREQLTKLYEELSPTFEHLVEVFLVNEDLFDKFAKSEYSNAMEGADNWTGTVALGKRLLAVQTIGKVIVEQIERSRKTLTK